MADRLAIYRAALRLLGGSTIASLIEDHPSRHALDEAWQTTGDLLLSKGLWNFAIRNVELSNDEDVEALFGYDKAYSKPDDWVRTVSISDDATFRAGPADYEDEGSYWYTDADPLYVRYISDDEQYGWNVGAWRQPFADAFSAYLAFTCGLPISNDKGNRNDLNGLYKTLLADAKTLDAVDERVQFKPPGRLTRSRFGSRDRSRGDWRR
jgi:hypothetical protein